MYAKLAERDYIVYIAGLFSSGSLDSLLTHRVYSMAQLHKVLC